MFKRLALLFLVLGLTAGCSSDASRPTQPVSPAVQFSPADGATAVRLDSGVSLTFASAVNRGVVEGGFHLISEADMNGFCPNSAMAGHGSMDSIMTDPNMLAHMDSVHATHGSFSWNDAGTICTFKPDSLMQPQTRYMMHAGSGMVGMMSRMGGMMPAGQVTRSGDMVAHFQTMTSADHAGHH
jgi:hypothetical protein